MATLDVLTNEYALRHVGNTDEALATLAGATASQTFGPFYNPKPALRLAINITAISAGSLTVALKGYDQSSGASWTVIASTALTTTGLTLIEVGPTVPAAANLVAQDYAPVWYEVVATVATGPVTATIGAHSIAA
jgi:hypothetical protein